MMMKNEAGLGRRVRTAAGSVCGLFAVMRNKQIHRTLAVSAIIVGAGLAGAGEDSNSEDVGNEESSCHDDGSGDCSEDENSTNGDPVETTDGEAPRDEDKCENNGGGEQGVGKESVFGEVLRPVNWETGEKWETETDLVVRLPGADYRFTRQYTSDPSKANNPYDMGNTLANCVDAAKMSANVGSGWGWSNLRAATAEITWESIPNQQDPWRVGATIVGADITLYRPARKPRYVKGVPVGGSIPISGPGNQFAGGDFDMEQDEFGGLEPSPCEGMPEAVMYGEPGRWSQSFDMANGVGWITDDIDENGNYRTYIDTNGDSKALPDKILFNGSSTIWNDLDMVDAWIEVQWDLNRVVRADVYRPSSTGGVITQTVQYYHLVNENGLKVKYHDGTSYTTLNLPGTSNAVVPTPDLGTDGDLVMVVQSTATNPGDSSTSWRRQITQYRYHDNTSAPTSGDIRLRVEGADHQLKSVFSPQQVEYIAQLRSSVGSPTDLTVLNEAIEVLQIADDAAFDGALSDKVYEVASKIVTYDQVNDRVEWQFVQSGSCGCGTGGATNAVAFNYEWQEGWSRSYGGEDVNGISLHLREYGLSNFTSWPTMVYRTRMTDIMYLNPGPNEQPYVWNQVLVAGDVPAGATSDAWVSNRKYNASTRAMTGLGSPSSVLSYTPATGNTTAPSITISATEGLETQYTYDGENAGAIRIGVSGSAETVLEREYVDDAVSSRRRLVERVKRPRIAGVLNFEIVEFAYGYEGASTSKLDWKRTRMERELSSENGPSGPAQWIESWAFYDDKRQLIVTLDPDGITNRYEYDARTGTLVKVTRNYDPAGVASIPEIRLPTGTSGEPNNPFANLTANTDGALVTEYERDLRGRVTKVIQPDGISSWTIRGMDTDATRPGILYFSKISMPHQVESPGEYARPASKRLMDADSKIIRTERWDVEDDASYDPGGVGEDYASNSALTDTVELARSVTVQDVSGQANARKVWWDIANDLSMTTSSEYDAYGRETKATDAEGTVTLKSYDVLDRVVSVKVGTSEANALTVVEYFYDGDPAATPAHGIGNGNMTAMVLHEDGVKTRTTRMYYDNRDRLIATVSPDAPMSLTKYDNLGRSIESAVYPEPSSLPSLTNVQTAATSLPSDGSTLLNSGDRAWYTKTSYSQRGYVWKTQTAIDPAASVPTYLESHSWYDVGGETLASWSPNSGMSIREYDAHGRVTAVYITDRNNEINNTFDFDSATDPTGDRVLEQAEYTYNTTTGVLELMTAYMRPHNATVLGKLDNSTAVASYVGYVYDDALRGVATVNFGTNRSTFSTGGGAPVLSDYDTLAELRAATGILFSWRNYNNRGMVDETLAIQSGTAASDLITAKYFYDDAYRTIASVENYDNAAISWNATEQRYTVTGLDSAEPAEDRVTSFVYNDVGRVIKRVAHLPGPGGSEKVQITEYDYGVTNGSASNATDSLVNTNNLLNRVRYPKEDTGLAALASEGEFVVEYGFNRLGELRGIKDQNGTMRTLSRDEQGRVLTDEVETLGTYSIAGQTARTVDGAIREIGYAFDSLGRLTDIKSFTDTAGTAIRDHVQLGYTALWQIESIAQQHDGVVDASSPTVEYEYDTAAINGADKNYSRLVGLVYPKDAETTGTDTVKYFYNTGIDDRLSRVTEIRVEDLNGAVGIQTLMDYKRNGLGQMVIAEVPSAGTWGIQLDRFVNEDGTTTAGSYAGFDKFGRITRHMWTRSDFGVGTGGLANQPAILEVTHTYDRSSNRLTYNDDRVNLKLENLNRSFSYDRLHRLTEELRTNAGGGSTYAAMHNSRKWSLDMLGNWDSVNTDADDDGDFTDNEGGEYLDVRSHNEANEIESYGREIKSNFGTTISTYTDHRYDSAGNMTDNRTATSLPMNPETTLLSGLIHSYDAWNRLVKTVSEDSSQNQTTVSEYTYNGLGWRTSKTFDVAQGAYDGMDQKRVFLYDASWRMIEERIDTDIASNSDSTGTADDDADWISQQFWGIRYIDDAVAKRVDRDGDGDWLDAEASTWYQITDTQFSVAAILDADGLVYERIDYDAYGKAAHRYAGDEDGNGVVDVFDLFSIMSSPMHGTSIGNASYDPEFDLNLDGTIDLDDDWPSVLGAAIPSDWLSDPASATGPDNSIGYAGYVFNHEREDYSVRFRVYDPRLGRWMTRDPEGYIDGSSLVEYVQSRPVSAVDPTGLAATDFDFLIPVGPWPTSARPAKERGAGVVCNSSNEPVWVMLEDGGWKDLLPGQCAEADGIASGPNSTVNGCKPGEVFKVANGCTLILYSTGNFLTCPSLLSKYAQKKRGGCKPRNEFGAKPPPGKPYIPEPSSDTCPS